VNTTLAGARNLTRTIAPYTRPNETAAPLGAAKNEPGEIDPLVGVLADGTAYYAPSASSSTTAMPSSVISAVTRCG
jgi:hypothetical protein